MATIEDFQQHQIQDLASAEENNNIIPTSGELETAPLIQNKGQKVRTCARMQSNIHCRHRRCCVSSKAALLILLWNLILVAGFKSLLDPNFFRVLFETSDSFNTGVITYSVAAFLFLFYPLAGCLADIRWGRYKTVVYSVRVIWGSLVAMLVLGGVAAASIMIPVFLKPQELIDSYLSKYCSTHHDCSCQYSVWNTCFNCISSTYTLRSCLFQC
jgi:hypothetical protein